MPEVKVYIGIPTAEHARFAVFYDYVNMLQKPTGTVGASFHTNAGAYNRNLIIDDALAMGCTHILFIDDDMAFPPNALVRLLKHNLDLVSGLYFNRTHPHPPLLFTSRINNGDGYRRRYLKHNETGLTKVDACGFGFFLAKTHVFKHLEEPYIRHGEIKQDKRNEDLGFCRRITEAGFDIYCDLDVVCGHIGIATFWPSYNKKDNKWYTAVDTGSNELVTIEQETGEVITPLTK